jgi:ferrous iron transport protein A
MLLCQVKAGDEVTLKSIKGGSRMRSRLFSMGLLPGTKLSVLNPGGSGPLLIRVRDSNLAIGRRMAERITVE